MKDTKGNLHILAILDEWSPNFIKNVTMVQSAATFHVLLTSGESVDIVAQGANISFLDKPYFSSLVTNYDLVMVKIEDKNLSTRVANDSELAGVTALIGLSERNIVQELSESQNKKYWKRIAFLSLFGIVCMFLGHFIFSYIPIAVIISKFKALLAFDQNFIWMLIAGFIAQLVDGLLGMGYGVMSTTILLSQGLNPAAISGSIHTAEMFSSGASGFSHYKFGNINKRLFKTLLLPGVAGAIIGAALLIYFGEVFSGWLKPLISAYTLILGLRILLSAFKRKMQARKIKNAGWLAAAGGFLDSFGGGGWGPLVTSTLIAKGKTPKYVIGTVSLTEFFVTLGSAITFFIFLGTSHIQVILGLIVGGIIAAPFAAKLAGRLPLKTMLISVGLLIIFSSLRTLLLTAGIF